jgi:hypothetical protein
MFRRGRGFRRLFGPYGWLRLRNTNGPPEISREMDLDFRGDTAEAVPLLLRTGGRGTWPMNWLAFMASSISTFLRSIDPK